MTKSSQSSTSSSSPSSSSVFTRTRRTGVLHALAILLSPSATSSTSTAAAAAASTAPDTSHHRRLRGVVQKHNLNLNNDEDATKRRSNRKLYGRQFRNGFKALTSSHANIPPEHVPAQQEDESSATSSSTTATATSSTLVGEPVYFEKQSDNPQLEDVRLRIVGGSDSQEQRNFCMHLRWDMFEEQYLFAGCGGALISNCHVLTAAHCSSDGRVGLPDGLYCNAYNPFEGNYGQDFHFSPVGGTFVHPDFSGVNNQNDVAVLELETCVEDLSLYPVMNVADMAFLERLQVNEPLVVSGFGRLEEESTANVNHLQMVNVPYLPKGTCQSYYPGRISDDMLCAGNGVEGGIDACQGDSGGALFHQGATGGDTNQTAVGIVSWGTGCAQPGRPGVYSSVAYHRDWIKNIVCTHDRTDQSIPLCAGNTPPPTPAPAAAVVDEDGTSSTCAGLHATCDVQPCCGTLACKARTFGAAPTCAVPASSNRSPLSDGRGGSGGASKGTTP